MLYWWASPATVFYGSLHDHHHSVDRRDSGIHFLTLHTTRLVIENQMNTKQMTEIYIFSLMFEDWGLVRLQ
jgi:hypothetical protein